MKIKIYRDAIDPDDLEALKKLIEDAGHEPEVVDGLPGEDCEVGETVVIIIYSDAPSSAIADVMRNGDNGESVIGVWPKGSSATSVPDYLDSSGAGSCPWSAPDLADTIDNPTFKLPSGVERPNVETTHKNC